MDIQNKILKSVGVDKILHFLVIGYISLILFLFTSILLTFSISLALMLVKEIIDKYIRKTQFSNEDIYFGIVGLLSSYIIYLFV